MFTELVYIIPDESGSFDVWKRVGGAGIKRVSSFPPAPSGYYFSHWVGPDGSYQPDDSITLPKNQTIELYASMQTIYYSILYESNIGSIGSNPNPGTYNVKTPNITLANASSNASGWTEFLSWHRDSTYGRSSKISGVFIPKGSTGTKMAYARFIHTYKMSETPAMSVSGDKGCNPFWHYEGVSSIDRSPSADDMYYDINWGLKSGYDYDESSVSITSEADGPGPMGYKPEYRGHGEVVVYGYTMGTIQVSVSSKLITYTIAYNLGGGTGVHGNRTTYNVETSTFSLGQASLSRVGYTFKGWYTSSSGGTRIYTILKGSTGDMTAYAQWNPIRYNIKFHGQGVIAPVDKTNIAFDSAIGTLTEPTRVGYTFKGWYTSSSGGTLVTSSSKNLTYIDGATINLYAQWEIITYTITYHTNNGEGAHGNPTTYTIETDTIILQQGHLSRTGYIFKGWFTSSGGTTKRTEIAKGTTGNIVVYAEWDPIKYDVAFNLNGASGSISNLIGIEYDKTITENGKSLPAPSRSGYTFRGWYTSSSGGTKVENSSKNLRTSPGTDTLYAQWDIVTYNITYSVGNTGVTHTNPTTFTVETATITFNGVVPAGYTFVGWYTGANGTGTEYTSIVKGSLTSNLTLYAHISINTYQITYNLGDDSTYPGKNSNTTNPANYTVETPTITFNTSGISRPGWAVAGWNISSIEKGSTGDKTITMTWSPVQYKTYWRDTNGNYAEAGSSFYYKTSDVHTKSLTYSISKPKTGYLPSNRTFERTGTEGVNYGGNAPYNSNYPSSNDFIIPQGTYGDIYATYTYTPIKYNLKFNLNGGTGTTPGDITGLEYNKTITGNSKSLPTSGFSRTGYLFQGWFTLSSGGTKVENSSKNLSASNGANITLYAQWKEIGYQVKFYGADGTTQHGNTYNLTYEQYLGDLPSNPTRAGYKFNKWVYEGSATEVKSTDRRLTTSNGSVVKVISTWIPNSLTIKYNAGTVVEESRFPASGAMSDSTGAYDGMVAIKACSFTRGGYEFDYWVNSDSSANETKPGANDTENVNNLSSDLNNTTGTNKTITLTAVWKPISYTVSFVLGTEHLTGNDIPGAISSKTLTVEQTWSGKHGASPVISLVGFTFKGWYNGSNLYDFTSKMNNSNLTLNAKWEGKKYTVTHPEKYDESGATVKEYAYTSSLQNQEVLGLTSPVKNIRGEHNVLSRVKIKSGKNSSRYNSSIGYTSSNNTYKVIIPAGSYGNIETDTEWTARVRRVNIGQLVISGSKLKVGSTDITRVIMRDTENNKDIVLYEDDE